MSEGVPCAVQENLAIYPCCVCSVQSLICVQLCESMDCSMPGLSSITNSWSLLKLTSIESVMPPNHLILCRPLLLPPSIFPSIRVFSSESVLCITWPKDWSFSFNKFPSPSPRLKVGIKLGEKRFLEEGSVPEGCDLVKQRWGFPGGSVVKNPPTQEMQETQVQSPVGWEDSPGVGNGNPLQCPCLENPMDRGPWQSIVHGVAKSWRPLSN